MAALKKVDYRKKLSLVALKTQNHSFHEACRCFSILFYCLLWNTGELSQEGWTPIQAEPNSFHFILTSPFCPCLAVNKKLSAAELLSKWYPSKKVHIWDLFYHRNGR